MEDYFQVGIVTSTHGLKGEVKVFPTTDDPKRFKRLKEVILDIRGQRLKLEIESVRFFKRMVILKFQGLDDINDVEKFRQGSLMVARKDAVRLGRDEYFVADLMGLKVVDEQDRELGTLREVLETGANDVYVIDMNDGRELLLPAIKQCILQVNVEEGWIRVHVLEGLLDEEPSGEKG